MGKAIDDEVLLALTKKGGGGGGTDDYENLSHKPQVNGHTLEGNKTTNDLGIKFEDLPDAPTIPNDLADLQDDATHRLVTDTEKTTWNGKSDFSGVYADLSGKPTLGTASAKNVPASGDALSGEVVLGSDSRLTNSRPASDVSSWAKQSTKPTYTASEVGAIPSTDKGANGGVATLGNDGIVPSNQLPTMFDGDYNSLTNKPTLGTAAAKDVPSAGNASLTEVVMGSDSRLSDNRNAKDVYPWAKAATKPTYTATEVGAIPSTDKGANGGVAELDANGKVPSSQLPSYVDDVLSYASQSAFPATGETGKIYIAEDTNKTYRWSGSAYAEISASLALGETSSTAYRGDRGKTAYAHSQTTGNPHGTTKSDVGLSNVPNVSTNDQTPTFTEASTRNNIVSGEKLSVIFGKIQKFFNDLKTVAFSGSYNDLSNKPSIPTKTSDITNDSNFVSDANYVHTDNNFTTSEKTKLAGIASGAEANVQANWSQTNTSADDFIKNKPSLATVATSGSYADLSNKPNAEDILMSDGVTSVEDALDEMTSNITSSTALSFNTEYTASSDGYVRGIVNAGSNKFVQIMLFLNSSGTYGAIAKVGDSPNEGQVCTLYVRKGMKYKIQCSSTNDATCSFIPLS